MTASATASPAVRTSRRASAGRILVLVAVGLVGGVLSGLFGVGGGIVMVPLLVAFARMDQRRAAATSLIAILPAAIAGSITYGLNGEIDLLAGLFVAVGAVVGAVIGTRLLARLPLYWLRWMFVVLLLLVAARSAFIPPERGGDGVDLGLWWTVPGLILLGLVMGIASGLFGIGGGVIAVPGLVVLFGAGDLVAKGTSLAVMVPTSISGTIGNLRRRLADLRAGLVVGVAATLASFGGVALAFLLPPELSGILFAVLLLVAAVQLSIKAWRAGRGDGARPRTRRTRAERRAARSRR